jgi:uncharacterized protein YkwD
MMKRVGLSIALVGTFFSQTVKADMLDYYMMSVLPSIVQAKGNIPPVANAGEDKFAHVDQAITITGTASDSDGSITSVKWTKDGQTLATTLQFDYTPTQTGADTLTLIVTDNDGATGSSSMIVNSRPVGIDYIPYDAPPISEADKAAYLKATNDARAAGQDCGVYGYMPPVDPLVWSDELYKAAYEHSEDMAKVGETSPDIDHMGSGTESDWTAQVLELDHGSSPWERARNNGFEVGGKWANGENIHSYPETVEIAMKDWIERDGHCANIMNPETKYLGLAVVYNPNAIWKYYWTQLFGAD